MRTLNTIATQDPWESYRDKDHGHDRPKVPEPATYGLFLMGIILLVIWLRRKK